MFHNLHYLFYTDVCLKKKYRMYWNNLVCFISSKFVFLKSWVHKWSKYYELYKSNSNRICKVGKLCLVNCSVWIRVLWRGIHTKTILFLNLFLCSSLNSSSNTWNIARLSKRWSAYVMKFSIVKLSLYLNELITWWSRWLAFFLPPLVFISRIFLTSWDYSKFYMWIQIFPGSKFFAWFGYRFNTIRLPTVHWNITNANMVHCRVAKHYKNHVRVHACTV